MDFPVLEKVEVNGENTHPLFVFLRNNSELFNSKDMKAKVIPWNFAKFMVDSNGRVIQFFRPNEPMDQVTAFIEGHLNK